MAKVELNLGEAIELVKRARVEIYSLYGIAPTAPEKEIKDYIKRLKENKKIIHTIKEVSKVTSKNSIGFRTNGAIWVCGPDIRVFTQGDEIKLKVNLEKEELKEFVNKFHSQRFIQENMETPKNFITYDFIIYVINRVIRHYKKILKIRSKKTYLMDQKVYKILKEKGEY